MTLLLDSAILSYLKNSEKRVYCFPVILRIKSSLQMCCNPTVHFKIRLIKFNFCCNSIILTASSKLKNSIFSKTRSWQIRQYRTETAMLSFYDSIREYPQNRQKKTMRKTDMSLLYIPRQINIYIIYMLVIIHRFCNN